MADLIYTTPDGIETTVQIKDNTPVKITLPSDLSEVVVHVSSPNIRTATRHIGGRPKDRRDL